MASGESLSVKSAFKDFCDKGNEITTTGLTKWMKKAEVFGKACNSNCSDIAFFKVKRDKRKKTINYEEFIDLMKEMAPEYAKDHNKDPATAEVEMLIKLARTKNTVPPLRVSKTGIVDKLTDVRLYTGMHKERFDKNGRGLGIDGREYRGANDGYVWCYRNKNTYDKTH